MNLNSQSEIPDRESSDVAVRDYFQRLASEKHVGDMRIREEIEASRGDSLRQRSLIGDYRTVDVVGGVSAADMEAIQQTGDQFQPEPTRATFESAERLSPIRVSLPDTVIEGSTKVPRLDRRSRDDSDGIQLFEYTGQAGLSYDLAGSGLVETDEGVRGRFTVL